MGVMQISQLPKPGLRSVRRHSEKSLDDPAISSTSDALFVVDMTILADLSGKIYALVIDFA